MFVGHLIAHALGRTSSGRFVNLVFMLAFVALLPIGAVVGLGAFTWNEIAKENSYSRQYGETWQTQYEYDFGSLSTARTKVAVAIAGAVATCGLGIWLYRLIIPTLRGADYRPPTRRRRRRRR